MESLKNFEWHRNVARHRLAFMPRRSKDAFWINEPYSGWNEKQNVDRSIKLGWHSENSKMPRGIYITEHVQTNRGKAYDIGQYEVIRPFESNDLLFMNLLNAPDTPHAWLDFTNRYGMIGRQSPLDEHHLAGEGGKNDKRFHIYRAEHQGEWRLLRRVLSKIHNYYPAIKRRDHKYLSKFIFWDSDDILREDEGIVLAGIKVRLPIAIRKYGYQYFEHIKRPDVFAPAAFALMDSINKYLERSVSLEAHFDPKTLEFSSLLKYGSLGAAIVAEALEYMAGHYEARQCVVCGSWYRVGTYQTRRDRIFCSAACKMRDYRARKARQSRP